MTNRQQWTLIAGAVMTAVFGVALAIKLRPQLNPVEIGSRAPEFHATDLRTNRRATLEDYRGRVVLVNIWATWCPPCRAEMPSMERLHKKLAGTEFRIVAVRVGGGAIFSQGEQGAHEAPALSRPPGPSVGIFSPPPRAAREGVGTLWRPP